ncbi:MAG TPA: transcriptional regulator, partial [Vicinamibacteria bacterium]|nr:transcriptional regulator [Vicinamibacteria bacterium]
VVDRRGTVWVGYWEVRGTGGGVARSDDGGRTFTLLAGIQGHAVRALAQSAAYPNVLVAGTLTGVFRTVDEGRTWRRISPEGHVDLKNVGSLAIDPQDAGVIYAGTWHLPWKTTDAGRTWYPISKGIIDDSDIMTLTLDRRSPRTVYATACSGIYRSTDAAGRWAKVRGIPSSSRRTRAFAQSPDDPNSLYAGTTEGLWISRDGGSSWTLATRSDVVINALLALPGGTLLLGGDGVGVLRSTDGQTWQASNQGFSERFVSRLAFDATRNRLLAGIWGDRRHGGVFFAPLPAGAWERLASGLEGREVLALATAGPSVLAGTDDGVYLWPGESSAWKRLPTVVGKAELHPRVSDVAAVSEKTFLVATSAGLLRTMDGGSTWKRPVLGAGGGVASIAVSSRNPAITLAATALGFFRSQDGGERWELIASALPTTP